MVLMSAELRPAIYTKRNLPHDMLMMNLFVLPACRFAIASLTHHDHALSKPALVTPGDMTFPVNGLGTRALNLTKTRFTFEATPAVTPPATLATPVP